jgi:NADPH-dependent curcumin reductase CurA
LAADFELVAEPIPVPADGEMVIRNVYCSLDPAIRAWMDDVPSYMPPIPLGAPIRASTYGCVVSSRAAGFAEGDHVVGLNAIEEFSVSSARGFTTRVDPAAVSSPTHFLSIFGAVGLTAYFGLFDVAQPKSGETVLVSGAAGAVGSLVGQLARLHGCRAVGIAGGPAKCRRLLEDYGFAAAIDYRGRDFSALSDAIAQACPGGVDVFFDNVGGVTLEAALAQMNSFGRIAVCGMISQYNAAEPVPGPSNLWQLIARSITMRGFVVRDFLPRFAEGAAAMMELVREGKLVFHEHIDEGIENFLPSFLRLFDGTNSGKLILKLN